jgi:hypothetical protein
MKLKAAYEFSSSDWDYVAGGYKHAPDSMIVPYYQIPLLYSLTFESKKYGSYKHNYDLNNLPQWRRNVTTAKNIWNSIQALPWTYTSMSNDLLSSYSEIVYEIFRQNCFHNATGNSADTQYDYKPGHGPEGVYEKTINVKKDGLYYDYQNYSCY